MDIVVSDIMKKQVISIYASLKVKGAAKVLENTGVGCVVVTAKNAPVGILVERDFVTNVSLKKLSTTVREVMPSPLIVISPSYTVKKLADLMKEKKIHKVPAVKNNQLLGIVTATDLIRKCIVDSGLEMRQLCNSFAQMTF